MWKGERLGGIIASVGILPLTTATIAEIAPAPDLDVIPIMIINGNDDPHVNAQLAKKTYSYYQSRPYTKTIDFIDDMGHRTTGNTDAQLLLSSFFTQYLKKEKASS